MEMKKSQEELFISFLISAALIVIVILSFTDCVTVTHHPGFSPWSTEYLTSLLSSQSTNQTTVYTQSFWPVFFCIYTPVQLLLLWLGKKRSVCVIGLILNIYFFGTFLFYLFALGGMKPIAYDLHPEYNEYVYGIPVYVIFALGAAVTVLYFFLLHFRRKRLALEAPEKKEEKPNFFISEDGGTLGKLRKTDDTSE